MAGLSDAVLARRQKDLNGYTLGYQNRLDKMVGTYAQDLAPAWQKMTKNLTKRVTYLYNEMGATNDPRKIMALKNKAERLEALASQLADDLKRMEGKLQPYYTGALKHSFEDSYYIQSFTLEQAARVSVTVPIVTPAQVLGVVANPWLGDGANYSTRLRANTLYLAEKMRGAVAQAVANGWSITEAARSIQDVAGEGYFNAVRLLRTEMNRAAALASSYSFMQNADILDGKRWNATLDGKTAPKDAKNDGKLYDLDYDTTEKPGVPGQRIPNHPNCRCKWTPVLSATGVSDRERIARDKDGNRIYTKARTYEEYAKERGLPSLKGRLERDNLKSYLRPGETVADFNKRVVRWKAPAGGTVTVPKPIWEEVKNQAPPTATTADIRKELAKEFPVTDFHNQDMADTFYKSMEEAPEEYRNFLRANYRQGIKGFTATREGSHYRNTSSNINININSIADLVPDPSKPWKYRRVNGTLIHEIGHGLDYGLNRALGGNSWDAISTKGAFSDAVDKAVDEFKKVRSTALNTGWQRTTKDPKKILAKTKAMEAAKGKLEDLKKAIQYNDAPFNASPYIDGKYGSRPEYAGLSDIIDGITSKTVNGGYGHDAEYWTRPGAQQKEIFANLFEMKVHRQDDAYEFLRKEYPDIIEAFEEIIKTNTGG